MSLQFGTITKWVLLNLVDIAWFGGLWFGSLIPNQATYIQFGSQIWCNYNKASFWTAKSGTIHCMAVWCTNFHTQFGLLELTHKTITSPHPLCCLRFAWGCWPYYHSIVSLYQKDITMSGLTIIVPIAPTQYHLYVYWFMLYNCQPLRHDWYIALIILYFITEHMCLLRGVDHLCGLHYYI